MKNEDDLRVNFVGVKFSSSEHNDILLAAENSGLDKSEYIRQAIEEKLINDNPKLLKKRKKELQEELEKIEKQEEIFKQKNNESTNLTDNEIKFLIESKEKVERNPNFLDGRINLFINDFGKTYKLSRKDFYKLMDEAETQEKEISQEMPQ